VRSWASVSSLSVQPFLELGFKKREKNFQQTELLDSKALSDAAFRGKARRSQKTNFLCGALESPTETAPEEVTAGAFQTTAGSGVGILSLQKKVRGDAPAEPDFRTKEIG